MIVSREDIINVLDTIRAVPYSNGLHIVFRNDTVSPQNDEKHFDTIRKILEDRLKQPDYKALADEMYKILKMFDCNFVNEVKSKYEQLKENEE